MSNNPPSTIVTERVDDIPLLIHQLKQMKLPQLLDAHFPTHGNWNGLSLGWTATIWLTYILSQADHRLNQVQDWIAQHIETLKKCTGQTISDLNFADDRLSAILRRLNEDNTWENYEQEQGKHLIRVYELPSDRVRLDTTTASTYQAPTLNGLFQLGQSKDHRPSLAQVKIMLASLDPLGLPLATEIVDGSRADDPLYEPTIEQVRATLNRSGVLYVGDSKMAAESIRASIANNNDHYLMPLPATIIPTEVLDTYLEPVLESSQALTNIYRELANGSSHQIAEGYECISTNQLERDGQVIVWEERRLVIRSFKYALAQEKSLRKRITKAKEAIAKLTTRRQGKKRLTSLVEVQTAADEILKRYSVKGLLQVQASEILVKRHIRPYLDRPARTETNRQLSVSVQTNETALDKAISRLGWRIYATNAPMESLSISEALLAYRDQYLAERGFGRLKGQALSLVPMYLQRDDHATGLIRLLTIGLRVLTLIEFVVRRNLSGASIAGIYAGNPKRETKRPTAEAILSAFKNLNWVIIKSSEILSYFTPLSELQQGILNLLGFPHTIYTPRLENNFV